MGDHARMIHKLVEAGADLTIEADTKNSPANNILEICIYICNYHTIKNILQNGADVFLDQPMKSENTDYRGKLPLAIAYGFDHVEIVKELVIFYESKGRLEYAKQIIQQAEKPYNPEKCMKCLKYKELT